jgi:ATPase family associated with various cellular activities (AAA)
LRPADGLVELLHGSRVDLALLGLDDRIRDAEADSPPAGISAADLGTLAAAFGSGLVDVVGVWGAGRRGADAVVAALCAGAAPVRVSATEAVAGLQRASVRGRVCVVDLPSDRSDADDDAVASVVASAGVPTVLVGVEPLRSPRLWADRRVAELSAGEPGRAEAWHAWSGSFPDLPEKTVDDLTTRFALPADDVAAVAALDRTAAAWSVNGSRPTLDQLAARVSRPRSARLATVRTPRRGRELLVLPPAEERRVLQVAEDFRAWPRVAETWRLDRFGGAGMTALFAGDPGTGKTLAAEVIAGEVGLDLMLVDLSLLVSKWVGETEKNLDAVFTEASRSHCVLFFDEADAMFGRRGEVSRGADRYANLEVGYLLQRLDRYDGLVVLATNLRDQLDEAFTRRFHHLVHFPSPRPAERRRIWELVLGPPVRLDGSIDLALLESLELTGAGIAAVVRSAALAVHHDGREGLTMDDLVGAAARQFQRESRLVPPGLLVPDASW